jgi:YgiT-type zinc finger domain-containing protein
MDTLGQRLKETRKNKGLTQIQLADKIGAKHNSVSNWETDQNKPGPNTIKRLCSVLNIEPDYLLCKEIKANSSSLTYPERNLLYKYRLLDDKGKSMLDTALEREYNRCKSPDVSDIIKMTPEEENACLMPHAVHEPTDIEVTDEMRKYDEEQMDNGDLLVEECYRRCLSCKTVNIKASSTTYFVQLKNCYAIIENVPCMTCEHCGDAYFSASVSEKIDNILKQLKKIASKIFIIDYATIAERQER